MGKIINNSKIRVSVIFILVMSLSFATPAVFFEGKTDASIYKNVKFYSAVAKKEINTGVKFDVYYFRNDATQYEKNNKRLAEFSAVASTTAYFKNAKSKSPYAVWLLEDMGFDDIAINNYKSGKDPSDGVGYVFAQKHVFIDGKPVTLVAVIIRGTTEGEWFGNFNITGNGAKENYIPEEKHRGFALAAQTLNKDLDKYLEKNDIDLNSENTRLWITGHSRGAAVANIVAADSTIKYGNSRVYAYTFATPNVTRAPNKIDGERNDEYFKNILNFVSNEDFITQVPLSKSKWEYQKYGNTVIVNPTSVFKKFIMEKKFNKLTGGKYSTFSEARTREAITDMGKIAPSVPVYYKGKKYLGAVRKPQFYFNNIAKLRVYGNDSLIDKAKIGVAYADMQSYSMYNGYYANLNSYFSRENLSMLLHSHSPETYISFVRAL